MIQPTASFKDNLHLLPSVDGLARIDLIDPNGTIVGSILNQPGKQGALAVYQYLQQVFGAVDVEAAVHGLVVFAEHTVDARNRPGAHPNINLLLDIVNGGASLEARLIYA